MPVKNKQKLIVLLGPTASGKSRMALRLAKKFKGYIVSADSRQIYKGMTVGTAKPKGRIKDLRPGSRSKFDKVYYVEDVPHFMMDIIDPNDEFTLADWQKEVKIILNSKIINSKYKIPLIVGGTGLYISALVNNFNLPPGKIDRQTREKLQTMDLKKLLQRLKKLDPETFKLIDKANKRRVVRALEYVLTNRKPFYRNVGSSTPPYDTLRLGITLARPKLYELIDKRVDEMVKNGLITEVKKLMKKYSTDLPALSGIGYGQIARYLRGDLTKEAAVGIIKRDSRHYAKRQLAWFKRDENIHWIRNYNQAEKLVKNFLKKEGS